MNDEDTPQTDQDIIIRGLGFICLLLLVIVILLGAIVFGFAEVVVKPA